jgi:hypothetical protein
LKSTKQPQFFKPTSHYAGGIVVFFHAFTKTSKTFFGSSSVSAPPSLFSRKLDKSAQNWQPSVRAFVDSFLGSDCGDAIGAEADLPPMTMTVIMTSSPCLNPNSESVFTSKIGFPLHKSLSLEASELIEDAYFVFRVATDVEIGVEGNDNAGVAVFGRKGLRVMFTF